MDNKKILASSTVGIAIGIVLVLISTIAHIVPQYISSDAAKMANSVITVFDYLLIVVFALLYLWTGMRAAKKYRSDMLECGVAAAFTHTIVGIVSLIINILVGVLALANILNATGLKSNESILAGVMFGGAVGAIGIGAVSICGVGMIVLGALLNFMIGALGGYFGRSKTMY